MIELPSTILVLSTALFDSINPLSIGIFIIVLTYILGNGHKTKHLILFASTYLFTFFMSYLLIGVGSICLFSNMPARITGWILLAMAILITIIGILEVKDYFWYGRGISFRPPRHLIDKIHSLAGLVPTTFSMVLLGLLASVINLPVLGSPLLAVTGILRLDFSWNAVLTMVIFSLILVLPLVVILVFVANGLKISHVARWKEHSKATIRLFTGLMLVFLSWLLILSANGTINMG